MDKQLLFDVCVSAINYLIIPVGVLAVILIIYMVYRKKKKYKKEQHKNEFKQDK